MLSRNQKTRCSVTRQFSKKVAIFGFMLSMLILFSCEDTKMEEYYEKPEWIKGNIFETLEEAGNYSIFLKGIELSGNKQMVDGKSILTVMAPNDEAFTHYLQENYGTKEIEDLPLTEIKKLIGFHIMYYAYGTDRMLNYRPFEGDDATKEEKEVLAGMYYKHRTKSSDLPFIEWSEDWRDSVMVYPLERHLPVFSYHFFNTKQIDATYNYEYFFPESQWKGGNSGFNISNAAVELTDDGKYEVIASNGYIYKVDKVLRPLETIYTELTSRASEFSDFLEMYDRTKSYVPNNDLTLQYGNGRTLYLIDHYPLPNIAQEWYSPIHYNVALNSSVSFSLFAPTNRALANFFDDYWKVGGYESLQEVSSASMNYLLLNSIYQPKQIEKAQVIFPEEIKRGEVESSLGTVVSFDVDAVPAENRIMCLNGSLYGCEVLATPAIFGAITGPAFQYKKFGHYLQMLTNNGNDSQLNLIKPFLSDETRYIALFPSNEMVEAAGITKDPRTGVLMRGTKAVGTSEQALYARSHVVNLDGIPGGHTKFDNSGVQVFRTMNPDYRFYWYVINGKITTSMKFRELLLPEAPAWDDLFSNFEELTFRGEEWSNGKAYAYDGSLFEAAWDNALVAQPNFRLLMYNLGRNDETLPYHGFVNLLVKANLYSSSSFNFIFENYFAFIPTTQAIKTALEAGKIPGIAFNPEGESEYYFDKCTVTDEAALQGYLKMYFLPESTAEMTNFPYVGWGENPSSLPTLHEYDKEVDGKTRLVTTHLEIQDTGSKLGVRVKEEGHNFIDVVGDYHYLPFVFQDAGVHFIEACFDSVN